MSSAEFAEWQAYNNHDPFGGFRSDLQAAIVARTIAAMFVGKEAPDISTFLPTFWAPEEDEDAEGHEEAPALVLQSKINTLMTALGGARTTKKEA